MRRLAERIECPEDITQHLVDLFGVNRFDGPIFRLVWGQTETIRLLSPEGVYEDHLVGHNQPCWILQQWKPPECYGTPEMWAFYNSENGVPVMDYPEFGMYEELVTFLSKHYDPATHALEIKTIPLDWAVIERAIPMLIRSQEMTEYQKRAAEQAEKEFENAQIVNEIADRLDSELPSFYGPVSFAGQRQRTALIDRKMAETERLWKLMDLRRRPTRGMFQMPVRKTKGQLEYERRLAGESDPYEN